MRQHVQRTFDSGVQPALVSNGLVGMRREANPLAPADVSLNGLVGTHESISVEAGARAPDPLAVDVSINGYPSSTYRDHVRVIEQRYDFSCGELTSDLVYEIDGVRTVIHVLTLASRSSPTIVLQRTEIEVSVGCDLRLMVYIATELVPGRCLQRVTPSRNLDGTILWSAAGDLSQCGVAMASHLESPELERTKRDDYGHEHDSIRKHYFLHAAAGKRYTLFQTAALVPGVMHSEPHWQAARMVGIAQWHGFESLAEQNRLVWAELWKGRPIVDGATDEWQDVIDASFFYLHSSIHQSSPLSLSPFGLGDRSAYKGHVFWDTESFMFVPVLLTAPDSADAILRYRSERLGAARRNAALHGHRGAMFPWQSGLHGDEVTEINAGFDGGAAELHVSMDVALAFSLHAAVVGDTQFTENQAWPVVAAVSEWICSRAEQTARGFEIRHVTGVDESLHNVSNNAFTNLSARLVLAQAIRLAKRLGRPVPSEWVDVMNLLFIPTNGSGAILPHEGYEDSGRGCHPGTLMAFYPYGYSHSNSVDEATLRYYLDRSDSYRDGAMMTAGLGVFAARLGDRELAQELFDRGNLPYVSESFLQFTEIPRHAIATRAAIDKSRWHATPFVTHAGGLLGALLHGLPGLNLFADTVSGMTDTVVRLPSAWKAVRAERIWIQGQPMRLEATHGQRPVLTPAESG